MAGRSLSYVRYRSRRRYQGLKTFAQDIWQFPYKRLEKRGRGMNREDEGDILDVMGVMYFHPPTYPSHERKGKKGEMPLGWRNERNASFWLCENPPPHPPHDDDDDVSTHAVTRARSPPSPF